MVIPTSPDPADTDEDEGRTFATCVLGQTSRPLRARPTQRKNEATNQGGTAAK